LQRPGEVVPLQHGLEERDVRVRLALRLPTFDHLELGVGFAERDEEGLIGEALAVQQFDPLAQPQPQHAADLVRLIARQDDRVAGEGFR